MISDRQERIAFGATQANGTIDRLFEARMLEPLERSFSPLRSTDQILVSEANNDWQKTMS
jgi:hypothetical protein